MEQGLENFLEVHKRRVNEFTTELEANKQFN